MRSSSRNAAIFSLTVLSALFTGCGSSHVNTPSSPTPTPGSPSSPGGSSATFSVASIVPAAGATQVPLNATVQITFSSAANTSTVNTTNIKVTDPNAVSGAVSYNSMTNTAVFTPAAPLTASTTYTVTVSGVTGTNGAKLANTYTSTFATVAPGTSPNPPPPTPPPAPVTLQYQAPLLQGQSTANGKVTVDTTGNVAIQLTGAAASTTYSVQFCPAVDSLNSNASAATCLNIATLATNASGDGSATAMFPQPGNWAGDFEVMLGSKQMYGTYLWPAVPNQTYMATLEPKMSTNNGWDTTLSKQDPLTSGTVTYTNGNVTFTLTGGLANTTYESNESETVYIDGSGTYGLNTFTTDAKGDATSSTTASDSGGDIFQVGPNNSNVYAGYIGGFTVPKP